MKSFLVVLLFLVATSVASAEPFYCDITWNPTDLPPALRHITLKFDTKVWEADNIANFSDATGYGYAHGGYTYTYHTLQLPQGKRWWAALRTGNQRQILGYDGKLYWVSWLGDTHHDLLNHVTEFHVQLVWGLEDH